MTKFDFEAMSDSVWDPVTIARPYAEVLEELPYADGEEEDRILAELYEGSCNLGFIGREYVLTAEKGLYIFEKGDEGIPGKAYVPQGINSYVGRFACHNLLDIGEPVNLSGICLYFEGVQAISGRDTSIINLYETDVEAMFYAPIGSIDDFAPRLG